MLVGREHQIRNVSLKMIETQCLGGWIRSAQQRVEIGHKPDVDLRKRNCQLSRRLERRSNASGVPVEYNSHGRSTDGSWPLVADQWATAARYCPSPRAEYHSKANVVSKEGFCQHSFQERAKLTYSRITALSAQAQSPWRIAGTRPRGLASSNCVGAGLLYGSISQYW
jgi:hypothetical protein